MSDRTTSAPTRPAHVCSWSAAAARNVSAAPSSTVRPSPTRARASLPQAVVLPVPFTPTTSSTAGRSPCGAVRSVRSMPGPISAIRSARSRARTSPGSRVPATLTWVCSRSTISRAGLTPMSAVISVSSISSQAASSRLPEDSRPSSTEPRADCDRASRPRSRAIRPADGGGASGAGGRGGTAGPGGARRSCGGACPGSSVAVPVPDCPAPGCPAPGCPAPAGRPGRSGPGGGLAAARADQGGDERRRRHRRRQRRRRQ